MRRCTLRLANAVRHLAQVLARIVRTNRIDDQRSVLAYRHSRLQRSHLAHWRSLAEPAHRYVARHCFGLARERGLFALQLRLVGGRHLDHRDQHGRYVVRGRRKETERSKCANGIDMSVRMKGARKRTKYGVYNALGTENKMFLFFHFFKM